MQGILARAGRVSAWKGAVALLACATALGASSPVASAAGTDHFAIDAWIATANGPWRDTLSRVYVNDLAGSYGALELAINWDGSWAQSQPYYAYGNAVYHDFCGCATRYGYAESLGWPYTEKVNAHQNYS